MTGRNALNVKYKNCPFPGLNGFLDYFFFFLVFAVAPQQQQSPILHLPALLKGCFVFRKFPGNIGSSRMI
jgi:hypothetical protein